jgi:YD repeat-containing protein
MPSKMRHGLLISLVVISLIVISFNTSYTDTTNYIYDELNRLIRVEYGDGTVIEYTYDKAGNRLEKAISEFTTPASIPGCVLWLRSDLGITKDAQNRLSSWADQSVTGYSFVQDSDSLKPLWVADQLNGYPVIRADGIDDWMSAANVVLGVAETTFVVVRPTTDFFMEHGPNANSNPGRYIYTNRTDLFGFIDQLSRSGTGAYSHD